MKGAALSIVALVFPLAAATGQPTDQQCYEHMDWGIRNWSNLTRHDKDAFLADYAGEAGGFADWFKRELTNRSTRLPS